MTTVKFTEPSPYTEVQRNEHYTDYKYAKFLKDIGAREGDTSTRLKQHTVALFGLGRAGTIHFVNLTSNRKFHLKYVVEEEPKKFFRLQEKYCLPQAKLLPVEEADKVFSDKEIDGVIIATPTFTHEELVTKALKGGKAVLCEKPISQDYEGIKRCYEMSKQVKKPLICAFNRRYEPAYIEVRNQVLDGKVGRVQLIKTVARDSPLPSLEYLKASGGIFHDCGVHDIDLICWILGEYPEKVFAAATAFIPEIKDIKDYDTVAMTFIFPSGTIGMVDLSRYAVYGYDQRVEVFGPKGMVSAANERPMSVSYSALERESQPPIFHSFPSRYREGYKNELLWFSTKLEEQYEDDNFGEHILKVSRIASALEESAKTGRMIPVQY